LCPDLTRHNEWGTEKWGVTHEKGIKGKDPLRKKKKCTHKRPSLKPPDGLEGGTISQELSRPTIHPARGNIRQLGGEGRPLCLGGACHTLSGHKTIKKAGEGKE